MSTPPPGDRLPAPTPPTTAGNLRSEERGRRLAYVVLGLGQWLLALGVYAAPTLGVRLPALGTWAFSQVLLLGTLIADLGLVAGKGVVVLLWGLDYLLGGLLLWWLCERRLSWSRWGPWRRAGVAWLLAQILFLLLLLALAATGYLSE